MKTFKKIKKYRTRYFKNAVNGKTEKFTMCTLFIRTVQNNVRIFGSYVPYSATQGQTNRDALQHISFYRFHCFLVK